MRTSEEQLPGWTLAEFRDDARIAGRDLQKSERESAERVEAVRGLVVEYVDEPACDADHLARWWDGYAFLAYTSAFHDHPWGERPAGPRWRLLAPFSRPATREEAALLGRWARHPRRRAGIVDAATEQPWRVVAVPAINPGRYHSVLRDGAPIDPDQALRQLSEWEVADRRDAAAATLAGTSVADAVGDLLTRAARPPAPVRWPWAPLERRIGPLFPGRSVRVVAADPDLRGALLLAAAVSAAASGAQVLIATTHTARIELGARLLALEGQATAADLLAGTRAAEAVAASGERAAGALPRLHLWAPGRGSRSIEQLEDEARALANLGDRQPPVLIFDPVEGWDEGRAAVAGRRAFAAAIEDLARPGGLEPDWPGAVVLAGSADPDPVLGSAAALQRAWDEDPGALAARLATDGAELDFVADVVLAVAADPIGAPRRVAVAVVRNGDGPVGIDTLSWDLSTGRLTAAAAPA